MVIIDNTSSARRASPVGVARGSRGPREQSQSVVTGGTICTHTNTCIHTYGESFTDSSSSEKSHVAHLFVSADQTIPPPLNSSPCKHARLVGTARTWPQWGFHRTFGHLDYLYYPYWWEGEWKDVGESNKDRVILRWKHSRAKGRKINERWWWNKDPFKQRSCSWIPVERDEKKDEIQRQSIPYQTTSGHAEEDETWMSE